MSKSLSFYNLTGGLNTVQDLATINSTPNRTESPDMLNIEYYKLGGIQTMKGNKQFGDTASFVNAPIELRDIICGIEYTLGNDSYMVVANKVGEIFEYNKTTKTFDKKGQFTPPEDGEDFSDNRIYAVSYNNGIVLVNGKEALYYNRNKTPQVKVWTPSISITDENNNTVSTTFYPTCIASYRGRLFMGANVAEQSGTTYTGGMLFYSGVGLGTESVWEESSNYGEDAGAFKEFFEDSSNFTGLGTWAEYLVIHKEQNTYILNGTADLASDWELKPYSEYTVPSQQSYIVCNNCYYTYVPEAGGIYPLLNRSIYNNTYQGGDISSKIKDSFEYLDTLNYDKIFAVYHPRKKYIMFYLPTLMGNGSNYCYIYDIQTRTWLLRRVPQKVTCSFKFDNEIYIGVKDESTGEVKVLKEFSGKTFDGTPIDFYYLTPPFIWGGGTNKTTTKEFRIKFVNSSANHFYVESFKDGLTDTKEQRLVKNVNDNLNGLIWDIGLNEADKVYDGDYASATFYSYNGNGVTYYTKEPIATNPYTMVYANSEEAFVDSDSNIHYKLTEPLNYYKYFQLNHLVPTTSSDVDAIETVVSNQSFAWNLQGPADECYKNGNYYAWVNRNTGVCSTNLKPTEWIQWYGLQLGKSFRVSKTIFDSINSRLNRSYGAWSMKDYPNDIQVYDNGWKSGVFNVNGVPTYLELYTMWQDGSYVDDGLNYKLYYSINNNWYYAGKNETNTFKGYQTIPESQLSSDTVRGNQSQNEVPTGTEPLNITKSYTSGTNSITINVLIRGVSTPITLSRYTAGDRGKINSDTIYWTKTNEDGVVAVYSESNCETTSANGTISGDTLTYNTFNLTRYVQGDGVWYSYEYNKLLTFNNETSIYGADVIYEYPPEDDIIWEQTLTDTTWDYSQVDEPYIQDNRPDTEQALKEGIQAGNTYEDASLSVGVPGDAWLQPGYQTKRMLLPNQYFETVQFKFSGGGYNKDGTARYNDNICISGFEVDGIQLAETPWA